MKSPRTRAILRAQGYIKRSSGFYEKLGVCDVCTGKDTIDCRVCLTCGGTGLVTKLAVVEISRLLYKDKTFGDSGVIRRVR